tara:strand:+ start:6370 stop:8430 length:2061 start_codon:yes stop_codon:yes gene_type:complete
MAVSVLDANKFFRDRKKFLAQVLRGRTKKINSKNAEQKKSSLCTSQTRSDEDINASKKPRKASSTGQEQSLAAPGDIVPIVFCKRSTDGPQSFEVGGVWMQPSKAKQGSYNFVGIFLYPLSQGEIVSTPSAPTVYVGDTSLTARGGTIPTLTNYYRSTATMAAAPNVCPITSGKIFCHPDANSFIGHTSVKGKHLKYFPDHSVFYYNEFGLTIGSGDTTNTTFEIDGADVRIFEVEDGTDRTSAYWTNLGVSPSSITFRENNTDFSPFTGRAVGTIFNEALSVAPLGQYLAPFATGSTFVGASAADKVVAWERTSTVNNQTDTSKAATDTTLTGVVHEYHLSPVSDPTNFGSSYDFTDYADITFLEIQGDIYDESDTSKGEYKISTRQLSVLIEQGVKVPLYSAGTPGTTGASHHFVDLAMHLFAINKRLVAGTTADISSPIDTSNLQALSTFHTNFGLFFNGIIEQSVNIIDFISTMSPFFFLAFVSENGRYAFRPLLPLTSGNEIDTTALTPTATFTDSDIIAGSFSKEYVEGEERRDVRVSVVFNESTKKRVGMQKSNLVRYSGVGSDARLVQYDLTDCCVRGVQANKFAKLQLAIRKHSTHTISFNVPLLTTSLLITDIIKVQRVRKNNVGDDRTETDHYQVTAISHSSDGVTTISAMHFPLDGSNVAKISDDVVNGNFDIN